jgi:gas vesicle protein
MFGGATPLTGHGGLISIQLEDTAMENKNDLNLEAKEEMIMENKNGSGKGALAFLFTAGGLLGAATALLLAPREGRQTRGKLKELGEGIKEKSRRYSNDLREKTAGFLEKRKNAVSEEKKILLAEPVSGQDEAGMEIPNPPPGV